MSDQSTRPALRFAVMPARDPAEPHRVSTPLELFFDLVFVVAVSQAAGSLHHAIVEGHVSTGLPGFASVFFAIWWAWVNWTWFASAYDNDDVIFRLLTFVQMAGALITAAGVADAFAGDSSIVVIGYAVMRLAQVVQWLRAAASDPERRTAALRFAAGIAAVQAFWIARLALPPAWAVASFVVLGAAELAVPVWAERGGATSWHPHHISERHMLLAMIMLGESVLASTLAVKSAMTSGVPGGELVTVSVCGFATVCAMWWIYNARPAHRFLRANRQGFAWGYGHFFIFASITAFGAGLSAVVEVKERGLAEHVAPLAVRGALAVPVAVFLISVWWVHIRPHRASAVSGVVHLVGAALAALTMLTPVPLELVALIMLAVVVAGELTRGPRPASARGARAGGAQRE